jgi:hypothetical protein
MSTPNNVLYWSGTMLDDASNLDTQLQETASSGFATILLWSLHVNTANPSKNIALGDLTWNGTLLVSSESGQPVFDPTGVLTKLSSRLTTLLANGTVKKIFFSIGSGGTSDFATIQQLYSTAQGQATLQNNFAALLKNLPMVTGFDFDVEDCFDVPSTAWLTVILASKFQAAVTYCPYFGLDNFWEPCLESVYQTAKTQPVAWFNLQCYSGGTGQDPVTWAASIKQNQQKNGVADASVFIVPGYAANNQAGDGPGICPNDFTSTLSPYKGKIGGAFVWNSQHIFDDPAPCNGANASIADYAKAITTALQ